MPRTISLLSGFSIVTSLMLASAAFAEGPPNGAVPEAKQARLLERFGDEGIDADRDGTLTRDEVETFFATNDLPCEKGRFRKGDSKGWGHAEMRGRGGPGGRHRGPDGPHRGLGGPHRGPGGRLGMMLHRLERLSGAAPPPRFDLARFPEADSDGDGILSETEWTEFAGLQRQRLLERLAERVPLADADNDGVLSDAELAAIRAWVAGRVLQRHPEADTDGDGTLSENERDALHASRMERRRARILGEHPEADLDGDGVLSDEEMESFRDNCPDRPRRKHRGPRRGPGSGCFDPSKG